MLPMFMSVAKVVMVLLGLSAALLAEEPPCRANDALLDCGADVLPCLFGVAWQAASAPRTLGGFSAADFASHVAAVSGFRARLAAVLQPILPGFAAVEVRNGLGFTAIATAFYVRGVGHAPHFSRALLRGQY